MEHIYQKISGWFDFDDIYLDQIINCTRPAHFVEVGAWKGKSTAYMAVEIARSGKNIQFDVVDTWLGSGLEHEHDPDIINGTLFETFSKNLAPAQGYFNPLQMTSVAAAELYSDASLDFVFIDGAHDYDSVRADIEVWTPKIRPGGTIAGHDYAFGPVMQAVNEKFLDVYQVRRSSWIVQL